MKLKRFKFEVKLETVDAIVVGAGVVGIATARALALAGLETLLLDGERIYGSWTSARNSEVIHAGIYYPGGSLKASLCVEGRHLLYAYCARRGAPHRRIGKVIVAHEPAQSPALDAIQGAAADAGVSDVRRLTRRELHLLEPALDCPDGLYSPSTGIVDSHAFMQAMLGEAEANGAQLVLNARVQRVTRQRENWVVQVDGEPVVASPILVNSAGLGAQPLARMIEGLAPEHVPREYFARGVYFTYSGAVPVSHLIYPAPEPGGLGIHLTLDMAGQARFGPDVEWIDQVDYTVDPGRHAGFLAAARRIWPALDAALLQPGYAGVRPKLSARGEPAADFAISVPADHGQSGLVNLFGIESPGLTASLAIAERVRDLVR